VVALLASSIAGAAGTSSTFFGTRFKTGESIQFKVEDTTTWWWGCCSCSESVVLGWRVTAATGQSVYSIVHDAPVSSSMWQGSWAQIDMNGVQVPVGQYILYVDTSAGTLSRCFTIYDPCDYCNRWSACSTCNEVASITDCACRTSLVFVSSCSGCFPLFGWFGGCYSSPCTSCSSCP
jgi:hypothetical protein